MLRFFLYIFYYSCCMTIYCKISVNRDKTFCILKYSAISHHYIHIDLNRICNQLVVGKEMQDYGVGQIYVLYTSSNYIHQMSGYWIIVSFFCIKNRRHIPVQKRSWFKLYSLDNYSRQLHTTVLENVIPVSSRCAQLLSSARATSCGVSSP